MSGCRDLLALVPPPADGGQSQVDWEDFRQTTGFEAPADYRQIVTEYGVGQFCGEFYVFAPGGPEGQDIVDEYQTSMDIIADPGWQEFVDEIGEGWLEPDGSRHPVDLRQDPPPFAPWGGGSAGGYGYWHKIGDDPDRWPVAYTDLADVWLYDRDGLASFLVNALTGRYPADKIDPSVTDGAPEFTRWPTG
ncbi:hypothetical protein ACPXCG_17415 [Gordonia sp. DT218]|uniref:hypothetical protein n=1 Tax=Gordonia sp. DT218 TaxID=3416659 RepID=UPI003CFAF21D